jgi:hypothetical protein
LEVELIFDAMEKLIYMEGFSQARTALALIIIIMSSMDLKASCETISLLAFNPSSFQPSINLPVIPPSASQAKSNFLKGEENIVRGYANIIAGSKNDLTGIGNLLAGDYNQAYGLSNSIQGNRNTIVSGNDNLISGIQNLLKGSTNKIIG